MIFKVRDWTSSLIFQAQNPNKKLTKGFDLDKNIFLKNEWYSKIVILEVGTGHLFSSSITQQQRYKNYHLGESRPWFFWNVC